MAKGATPENRGGKLVQGRSNLESKYKPTDSEIIPTNIIPLDLILGGGFPRGRFIEIASPSGLGKSSLMAHVARNFCSQGIRVDWFDFEHALTDSLKEGIGLLEHQESGLFTHFEPITYGDAEEILEGLEPSRYPVMIVIDSESSMLPDKALITSVADDAAMGIKARVSSNFLAKYKGWSKKNGIIIVFINQMRTKMEQRGRQFVVWEDSAGGNALKFYCDIRLRMRRVGDIVKEEETIEGMKKIIYGVEVVAWAVKNRNERSHIEITLPIIFGKGVSNLQIIKNVLINAGLVVQAGSYFKISMENVFEGNVQGNKGLNGFIKDNREAIDKYIKDNDLLFLVKEGKEE